MKDVLVKGGLAVSYWFDKWRAVAAMQQGEWWLRGRSYVRGALKGNAGQSTTEYAILVGVLVVIAILAIVAFRGKIQELWSQIADGINSL